MWACPRSDRSAFRALPSLAVVRQACGPGSESTAPLDPGNPAACGLRRGRPRTYPAYPSSQMPLCRRSRRSPRRTTDRRPVLPCSLYLCTQKPKGAAADLKICHGRLNEPFYSIEIGLSGHRCNSSGTTWPSSISICCKSCQWMPFAADLCETRE